MDGKEAAKKTAEAHAAAGEAPATPTVPRPKLVLADSFSPVGISTALMLAEIGAEAKFKGRVSQARAMATKIGEKLMADLARPS